MVEVVDYKIVIDCKRIVNIEVGQDHLEGNINSIRQPI